MITPVHNPLPNLILNGPLDLDARRLIYALSDASNAARTVFATLLLNADERGDCEGTIDHIAELSLLKPDTTRLTLRKLRRMGEVTVTRPGKGRKATVWHIAAIQQGGQDARTA